MSLGQIRITAHVGIHTLHSFTFNANISIEQLTKPFGTVLSPLPY